MELNEEEEKGKYLLKGSARNALIHFFSEFGCQMMKISIPSSSSFYLFLLSLQKDQEDFTMMMRHETLLSYVLNYVFFLTSLLVSICLRRSQKSNFKFQLFMGESLHVSFLKQWTVIWAILTLFSSLLASHSDLVN